MPENFKKRMLSDYTGSHVTTEGETSADQSSAAPPKRLRLSARTLVLDVQDVTEVSAAQAALTELRLQIQVLSENRANVSVEDLLATSEKLMQLFLSFPNPELRTYIIQTIGLLLCLPSGAACLSTLRGFFARILHSNPCVTVRTQLLRTLLEAGAVHKDNKAFCWHITAIVEDAVKKAESAEQPVFVAACLEVIGELFPFRDTSRKFVLRLWSLFERNEASEVRAAAYRMLSCLVDRGFLLDVRIYKRLCVGLEDLSANVRSCAMDLLLRLGQRFPTHQVANNQSGETMNLVDDVFCKICDRVNDWEIDIRAQAAALLGRMDGVTINYVMQTVDKKLMSDLRVKVAGHERQKQLYESGEWSSGRKWADDAPKERLQQDQVSLMSIGATGAFVLALEDEFQQVRARAVVSMAQLAAKHPSFGLTSLRLNRWLCRLGEATMLGRLRVIEQKLVILTNSVAGNKDRKGAEFLVDMFNDEIHDVRLKALQNFTLLGGGVELREDQLEMVLTVLQDASFDIRQELRVILPTFKYSSSQLVKMLHTELLNNLKQYPGDHPQICACLGRIGAANGGLVEAEVKGYLGLHPYLQSTEPKADDRVYIATMALVCSAGVTVPDIFNSFLDFHLRHYFLYRYKFPDWFPLLENVGSTALALRLRQTAESNPMQTLEAYLATFKRSVLSVRACKDKRTLIQSVSSQVHQHCQRDASLQTAREWIELQLQFLGEFVKNLSNVEENDGRMRRILASGKDQNVGDSLRTVVDELRTRFSRLRSSDKARLMIFSLQEKLLQVLNCGERFGDLVELDPGTELEITELTNWHRESSLPLPDWISAVQSAGSRIPRQRLFSWLRTNLPLPEMASSNLSRIEVNILSPPAYNEYPVNVVSGTIHRIALEATVGGCADLTGMVICLMMPDDKRLVVFLTEKDYVQENGKFVVKKDIAISQTVWTEAAALKIQLARIISGKSLSLSGAATYQLLQEDDMKKLIPLETPVVYRIKAIPVRTNV